jgi:tetratricopeptide (TPR) repeat protein/tRNA A-37 threonylcarbamoyl transferase component Bud32
MSEERHLLFGALAIRRALIDPTQFDEACASQAADPITLPLPDFLVQRGMISAEERTEVDTLVEDALRQHGGDARAALAAVRAEPTVDTVVGDDDEFATKVTVDDRSGDDLVRLAPVEPAVGERDRYTLTHLHATGGHGRVWLARDSAIGREVALKELRPEATGHPHVTQRFVTEARITGQLEHPGIVPVYELVTRSDDAHVYYTMRFIRGRTFRQAIRDYHERRAAGHARPTELLALLESFVGVCQAVAYAHSRGVIHRDLKGQNVVLGDFGEVMVLDWGLAKVVGQAEDAPEPDAPAIRAESVGEYATQHGHVLGTPAYMSPEQAQGVWERVGPKTDIYSLGAILYEILAGTPPFTGGNTAEVLRRVREEEPERPRRLCPSAPKALEAVCLKAIAKDPERRYGSAAELAQEVRCYLADEPVGAYREPWTTRAGRWARRHKTAVVAAGVLAVSATAGLAYAHARTVREQARTEQQRQYARRAVDDMYTQVAQQWLEDRLDPLQQSFLEKALASYERFAAEDAADAAIRRERALAYGRVGDIRQKLGRLGDAEVAYRRALDLLGRLVADAPGEADLRDAHATAHTRLGILLARRGSFPEAEGLLRNALEALTALAEGRPSEPKYRLHLAEANRALADLLRTNGRAREAEASFRRAIEPLERLVAEAPGAVGPRQDLASASDALGILLYEQGRLKEAEASYRRALGLQEALSAGSPTSPGLREDLAKTGNSLGLLLKEAGSAKDAEGILRRSLDHFERLASDFPLRPEYRRSLARGYLNLGLVLQALGGPADAERAYRRAIDVHAALKGDAPDDFKYRRDLARASNNLGTILAADGRTAEAERAYRDALEAYKKLAAEAPTVPDHRKALAGVEINLGSLWNAAGKPAEAEAAYSRASALLEKLVAEFPKVPSYRQTLALCLSNLGNTQAALSRPADAESSYRGAVVAFEALAAESPNVPGHRANLANVLMNLGELRRPDAEATCRRASALYEGLAAGPAATPAYRQGFARAQNNLGEVLASAHRPAEADEAFGRSIDQFEQLVAKASESPDYRSELGFVLENQGKLRLDAGRTAEARASLDRAIYHQRAAVDANPRQPSYRALLVGHLLVLARAHLALGEHAQAASIASELLRVAPERPDRRPDAARVLARCVPLAQGDAELTGSQRGSLAKSYADRAIDLLREALRANPKLAKRLKGDADLAPLGPREEFREMIGATEASPKSPEAKRPDGP